MAIQELLKASYTGSLGETTGAKWKNKAVVKGKIWSKTPNNKTQTDSVRSFECLNRVASAIASQWFYRLGIKAVNMHKHNAVAKLLKSSVKTHEFTPESFLEVFHEDGTVSVKSLSVDYGTGTISFSAETTYKPQVEKSESWLVVVFNQLGQVFYADSPRETAISMSFDAPVTERDMIYILVCSSKKIKNRVVLGGAIESKGTRYAQLDIASSDPNLTENGNAYELNVQLSESLPSGSYEIPIITHALRQTVMIDTPMSAYLVTADSQEAKLRFVPVSDSLDQIDVFDMGAYIKVESSTLRIGDVVYTLSESSLVAQYKKDVSYRLAEDVEVYAVANGFDFIFNSPVPEGFNFALEDTAFYSVGQEFVKEEISNATSAGTWNADRTEYHDEWGKSLVYATSQNPLRGGKFSLFCTSQQTGSVIKYESNMKNVNPYTRRLYCGNLDKNFRIQSYTPASFGIQNMVMLTAMTQAPNKVKTIYSPSGSEINVRYKVNGEVKAFTLADYTAAYHSSDFNGWTLPSAGTYYKGLELLQVTSDKAGTVELEIETVANTSYNYLVGIVCVYEHSTQML